MTITDKDRLDFIENLFLVVSPTFIEQRGYRPQMMPTGPNTWRVYKYEDHTLLSKNKPYVKLREAIDYAIKAMEGKINEM